MDYQLADYDTCALVTSKLAACEKHVPAWFTQNFETRVMCVLAMYMVGIMVGYRLGYRVGKKDGNPFQRLRVGSPLYAWLKDL